MSTNKNARVGTVVLPGWSETRTAATPLPVEVWLPAPFDDSDQRALKALRDGTGTGDQQQKALGWVLFACGHRNITYRSNSDRDSAFAEGKRSLAVQIYAMLEAAVRGSADDEQGTR